MQITANQKKVLVIGAGISIVPLIKRLKEYGFLAYATSYLKDDPGLKIADKSFNVSILDFEGLKNLCEQENISRVITGASDLGTIAVGHLNDYFGFSGIQKKQVLSVTNKWDFVNLQQEIGLPRPESHKITQKKDLLEVLPRLKFPVILKPFFSSGSRGIIIAKNDDEIMKNHDYVFNSSFLQKGYVIQRFIDGKEYGGECFVENGRVVFLELTDKFLNEYKVPIGHLVPSTLNSKAKESLVIQIQKIVDFLNVRFSIINIDTIVNEQGPIIIDFSFRYGGNLMPEIMNLKFNTDHYRRNIEYCLGQEKVGSPSPDGMNEGNFGVIIFGGNKKGVLKESKVKEINHILASETHLLEITFDINKYQEYEIFSQGNKRFGHAIFMAKNVEEYPMLLRIIETIIDS